MSKWLFLSTHAWNGSVRVGSHAFADAVHGLGNEVAFASAPLTPLHLLRGFGPAQRLRWTTALSGGTLCADGVVSLVPLAALSPDARPFLRSTFVRQGWGALCVPPFTRLLSRHGFDSPDVVFVDNVFYGPLLKRLRTGRTVLRIMDDHTAFPGWDDGLRPMIQAIVHRADMVIYSSPGLENYAHSYGHPFTRYLGNGVWAKRFQTLAQDAPDPVPHIPRPRAVYAGSMGPHLDVALLERTARTLPQVAFVMAGQTTDTVRPLRNLRNFHFLGTLPQDMLPGLFRHCDVGLIPFDTTNSRRLICGVNPLKLYEYSAIGLPVVSTYWAALAALDSPARLAHSHGDFISMLQDALNTPGEPMKRVLFAEANDWSNRIHELLTLFNKSGDLLT